MISLTDSQSKPAPELPLSLSWVPLELRANCRLKGKTVLLKVDAPFLAIKVVNMVFWLTN